MELQVVNGQVVDTYKKRSSQLLSEALNGDWTIAELRTFRADIQKEVDAVDTERKQLKKTMNDMFSSQFNELYSPTEVQTALADMDKHLKDKIAEKEAIRADEIKTLIESINDGAIPLTEFPDPKRWLKFSDKAVIEKINNIIVEYQLQDEPEDEPIITVPPKRTVELTLKIEDEDVAKEVMHYCRSLGLTIKSRRV